MRRRLVLGIIVVAVVVAGMTAITQMRRTPPPSSEPLGNVSARFTRPNLVGYQQGERQWSLKANVIEEIPEPTDTEVKLIEITEGLLYRGGQPHLRFTADGGTWRQSTEHLFLTGNVRFEQDSQEFFADSLTADMNAEQMRFVGNVVWRTDSRTEIRADEATYNSKDDVVEFHGTSGPVMVMIQGSDS